MRRSEVLPNIVVTQEEKDQIRQAAAQRGLTMSAYVRQMALTGQREQITETTRTREVSKKSVSDSSQRVSRAKPNFRPI